MFLTLEELIELTGRRRRDAQTKALRHMGIEHKIRPDGSVAVMTAHIEKEFDGSDPGAKKIRQTEPNWEAVR